MNIRTMTAPLVLMVVLTSETTADEKKPHVMAKLLLCFASISPIKIRSTDDSMAPIILQGDWVTGHPTNEITEGSLCVIVIKGQSLIRWVRTDGDSYLLLPENKKFQPLRIRKTDMEGMIQIVHVLARGISGDSPPTGLNEESRSVRTPAFLSLSFNRPE